MSLDKGMKNLKFDARLTEYNINRGLLSQEELKEHLTNLPDVSANAEYIKLDELEQSNRKSSGKSNPDLAPRLSAFKADNFHQSTTNDDAETDTDTDEDLDDDTDSDLETDEDDADIDKTDADSSDDESKKTFS